MPLSDYYDPVIRATGPKPGPDLSIVGRVPLSYRGSRGATVLVAAVDASHRMRRMADFRCDGVNDEVEIERARGQLGAAGGSTPGQVLLSEGVFAVNEMFAAITFDDAALIGQGPGTVLRMPDGADGDFVVRLPICARIWLAHLTINANKDNQATTPHALELLASGFCCINNVHVRDCDIGFRLYNGASDNILVNNRVVYNCTTGVRLNAAPDDYNIVVANNLRVAGTPIVNNSANSVVANNVV